MTTHALTAATGQLGRLVVDELLARGTAPGDVVALVRDPARAADLAARGVQVRVGDHDRPDTLGSGLAGVDALLLVSSDAVGRRTAQHRAVVDAAAAAGTARLAYTSVLRADTTDLPVAPEHVETEALLRDSGIPTALLRSGWCTENCAGLLDSARATGEVVTATGGATVSPAARADYAAAAAAALLDPATAGTVLELGGAGLTADDLARVVGEVVGREVVHREAGPEELTARLRAAGVDEGTAGFLTAVDVAASHGALAIDSATLERLVGRPLVPAADALRAAARG